MRKASILKLFTGLTILLLLLTAADTVELSPGARAYHQMTYDTESERVILYGGQIGPWMAKDSLSYETWAFDPEAQVWTMMSPSMGSTGSAGGDMTYDLQADRAILSAISQDWRTTETWAYDYNTNTWAQKASLPAGGWIGQRLVYDSESDRVILFGGLDFTNFKLVDETLAYDYNTDTWTNMQPRVHPKATNYHAMAYDPKIDRVLLWEAYVKGVAKPVIWLYDFNTNTWESREYTNGPVLRDYCAMVYDAKADRIILYGGDNAGKDDTWAYDANNNTWQQMQPAQNPGKLSRYAMAYAGNKAILFGGQLGTSYYVYEDTTWSYNFKNDMWTNISPGQ